MDEDIHRPERFLHPAPYEPVSSNINNTCNKKLISSIPMEKGEIPRTATMRGLPAKPPDRDQRTNE